MSSKVLFLETSIQATRGFHSKKRKKVVEDIIKDYKLTLSSSYVKMEFIRTYIRDLMYLYLLTQRLDDFSEIFRSIQNLSYHSNRRLKRVLDVLANYFSENKNKFTSNFLDRLKLYLPLAIKRHIVWFDESVDEVLDKVGCIKAKFFPILKNGVYKSFGGCKEVDKKCKIDEFIQDNIEQFKKILKEINNIIDSAERESKELNDMKKVLEKAIQRPAVMLTSKNCWKCGDAIIAVECPDKAKLFTTNQIHYQPICLSINKSVLDKNTDIFS